MDLPESSSSQPPPPWVILGRVARVEHDSVDEPGEVSFELAVRPRVSTVTVPMSLHPKPNYDDRDKHPYVVAADPEAGLLLQVSHWPFIGLDLDENPRGALLVARGFLPADPAAGRDAPVATAVARVPDRVRAGQPHIPRIRSLGLVSRPGTGGEDYVVAELRLNSSADDGATLLTFRAGSDAWVETELSCPSMYLARRHWSPHDVVAIDGKLWWVNLVWGLLGCDPFEEKPTLRYVELPTLLGDHSRVVQPPSIESSRMVTVSKGKVLCVEMARKLSDPVEETIVVVQSLEFDLRAGAGVPWWKWMSGNSIGVMWASHSYRASGMPHREVPVMLLVHPTEPDMVYFLLKDYLFSFDLLMSRVTEVAHKPGLVDVVDGAGNRQPPPISWRYVLAWKLPASLAKELDNLMDEDVALIPVEGSSSSSIPDLNDVPDPYEYDTATTDLGDTPSTDLGDTPSTDLGDTPSTDLDMNDTPIPDLNG